MGVSKETLLEEINRDIKHEADLMLRNAFFHVTKVSQESNYQAVSQLPEVYFHPARNNYLFQIDHTGIHTRNKIYRWRDVLLTGFKSEPVYKYTTNYSLLIGLRSGYIITLDAGSNIEADLAAIIELYKRKHRELLKNPPKPVKPFPYSTRRAKANDLPAIIQLFRNTIHRVNAKDYSSEQLKTWSAAGDNISLWEKRLAEQYFLVCENEKAITGFASLILQNGCIDLLYIHHDHLRKGIAGKLLAEIELQAKKAGQVEVWADVSITARPFFEANKFFVKRNYLKFVSGIEFNNVIMTKKLTA